MSLLAINNVSVSYAEHLACKDVSLNIKKGEFFTLLGPSGCGKTTLLRLIAGFIKTNSGHVLLNGTDITNVAIEKRNVGMVFQNYALFHHLDVFSNVAYGLMVKKTPKTEIIETVNKYLALVNLSQYAHRKINDLSGGEQQRVALARTLITEPQLLLLDEPLSNLDARLKDKMRYELEDIQKRLGITTIFVTHDQREAFAISDRVAILNKGQVIQVGTPQEVYQYPKNGFVASFVGETNLLKKEDCPFPTTKKVVGNYVSIRPQHIKLNPSSQNSNSVNCHVLDVKTKGALLEFWVGCGKLQLKVIVLNDASINLTLGENVYITVAEEHLHFLDN